MSRDPQSLTIRFPPEAKAGRLDRVLAAELQDRHSRSEIARWVRAGRVRLNGHPAKVATEVGAGDVVTVDLPAPTPSAIPAEDLPLVVVYEDADLAVVDKAAGMVTHPAGPLRTGTLVNALLFHLENLSGIGGVLRPGIVHRLDKGTTGLLVVAKNDESHRRLAAQLESRTLRRMYEAVAWGRVEPAEFDVDAPIGRHPRDRKRMAVVETGKPARSHVRVLFAGEVASHLEVRLDTGRTHQIRVHLRSRGHGLVGDEKYGGKKRALAGAPPWARSAAAELGKMIGRPALHARRLELEHPRSGAPLVFDSPLPEDLHRLVERMREETHANREIR